MLNISKHNISGKIDVKSIKSFNYISQEDSSKKFRLIIKILFALVFIIFFLPWTQNIRSYGKVTTLLPDQKPQKLHTVIAGRIEKWYVKEGDLVYKGDTILFISEIKDDYFDPNLLSRTQDQLESKELAVKSYMEKIKALDSQIDALVNNRNLKIDQCINKLKQSKLKVQSDSIEYQASLLNNQIAEEQFDRYEQLYEKGLKSKTDYEYRKLALQKTQAALITYENKLLSSKNDIINAQIEINSVKAEYQDKISKAESDKFTAMSNMYDAEVLVTKMQNQYMNYSMRTGFYYITAPQDGYITKTIQSGIGETLKEGEEILSIMPANYDLAVEMYIQPVDLPLIQKGQNVRIQFDGWPSIVFSGWPNVSYGTYGGVIFAVDNFIGENGKFRLLISPDNVHEWPKSLRVGGGTNNMLLLNDVPIWYELWRKINGFPPDYYVQEKAKDEKK